MTEEEWFVAARVCTRDGMKFGYVEGLNRYFDTARRQNVETAVRHELHRRKFDRYISDDDARPVLAPSSYLNDAIQHARLDAARAAYYGRMANLLRIAQR